jgi:sensor histidine kinase YesM
MPAPGFFHLLFIGTTFFQCVFILLQYYIYKRTDYRYYFLYIISVTVYLFLSLEAQIGFTSIFAPYPYLAKLLNIPLVLFAFWMYIRFGKNFIEEKHLKKLEKGIKWIEASFVAAILFYAISIPFGFSDTTLNMIFLPVSLIIFFQAVTLFLKLRAQKDSLNNFLLFGGILIAVGGITGSLIGLFLPNMGVGNPAIYYPLEATVILELLLLNTGLVYKTVFIEKKVSTAQQLLITQLQKNEQMQRSLTETSKQMAEVQLAALSAQMNPHFIFNCMNSVQKYILKNEKEKAMSFLQNFSELMRGVLDSSAKAKIALDEEINMLEKYLQLEQQRLENKFDYSITTSSDLQADFFEIPGMLIQPYVENAIWHGLMNLPDDKRGHLTINFEKQGEYIRCVICDNGVGRRKAAELEKEKSPHRKSYGMSISKKRIELLKKQGKQMPQVNVEDLVDINGQPAGVSVTVFILAE